MEASQSPKAKMVHHEGGYPASLKPTLPTSPHSKQPDSVASLRKKIGMVTISIGNIDTSEQDLLPGQAFKADDDDEDESSSQSEASSLEDEDSSDEEEDPDVLSTLDLHPMHSKQNAAGIRLPIGLPGCTDVKKMAVTAAADSKVGIRQANLMKTRVAMGKLTGTSSDFSMVVDLLHASVAVEPCSGPLAKARAVVCIVPANIDPGLVAEAKKARRPSSSVVRVVKDAFNTANSLAASGPMEKEVYGYLLCCPMADLQTVQAALARNGCCMTGLDKSYQVMKGEKAGSGSFGTVVVASDAEGDLVAIKRMREGTKKPVLEQEIAMLVRAQGHPTIVKFHAYFREDDPKPRTPPFSIVFDYYSRGDLYDRVAEGSRLQERHAMIPFRDLLEALRHLHARQIFHRDVKPENLLVVNSSNKVVLTDFGIATLTTDKEEMRKVSGTVGYASPEMLSGQATSYEGDAFGAGVVLFFMLSRSTPFLAPTSELMGAKTQQCQVNLNYQCFEHISDDCRSMMLKLMTKAVEERMTVEEALRVPTVAKSYVTCTEPSLASMAKDRKARKAPPPDQSSEQSEVVKPGHHMVALSVGELPALRKQLGKLSSRIPPGSPRPH